MCTITVTEFKENFGKYNKLAQKEEILVSHRGEIIYHLIPRKIAILSELDKYFNMLPEGATFDDVERK